MRAAALPIVVLPMLACGADRAIYSEPGAPGNVESVLESADDGPSDSNAGGLQCPPLPPDRPVVPGLAVGWAAEGTSSTTLQLGTHAFGCGTSVAALFSGAQGCPDLWALELVLPGAPLSPGELELSREHPGVLVHLERSSDGRGCARDTVHSASQGISGRLHILEVNEECIVGELVDVQLPTDDLPDLSGVFVAERC